MRHIVKCREPQNDKHNARVAHRRRSRIRRIKAKEVVAASRKKGRSPLHGPAQRKYHSNVTGCRRNFIHHT